MAEPDYERSRAHVRALDVSVERQWRLMNGERVEYGEMPPLGNQVLLNLLAARRARAHAESHRGFALGVAASINRNGRAIAIGHGANQRSAERDGHNEHAEQMMLAALRPGDLVTSLAIVGPVQTDQVSGVEADTTHPCSYRCQGLLAEHPAIAEQTVIVCANLDNTAMEWGVLEDFQRYHRGEPVKLGSATFETLPAVLTPPPSAEFHVLRDEDELEAAEWDAKVTIPITEWARARGIDWRRFG